MFSKAFNNRVTNHGNDWLGINTLGLTHSLTMRPFDRSWKKALKTLWKKEKLLVQAISPFPTMFFTLSKIEITIFASFILSSANAFNLVWFKILSSGNGLNDEYYMYYQNFNFSDNRIGGYETGECKQPESVGLALRLLVVPGPVLFTLIALIALWVYPIDERRRMEIKAEIKEWRSDVCFLSLNKCYFLSFFFFFL